MHLNGGRKCADFDGKLKAISSLATKTYCSSIAAKCLRALSGIFSPNLIDQSTCKMGLALACVITILHDDWSARLGDNRLYRVLKHLTAMPIAASFAQGYFLSKSKRNMV